VFDLLQQTLRTLMAQRLRTFLTLFGVVWGTSSVVFLVSWGRGVESMFEEGMQKMGKNVIFVGAGSIGEEFTPASDRRELWCEPGDLEAVKRGARVAELVGGESRGFGSATFGQRTISVEAHGVEPAVFELRAVSIASGRPIMQADLDHRRRVAVLGQKAREKLLGPQGRLGDWIRLDGRPHQVVGMLDRVGTQIARESTELDEQIWVPLTTYNAGRALPDANEDRIDTILLRVADRKDHDAAVREVRAILSRRLGVSASDEEAIRSFSAIKVLETIPTTAMAGLLLVVSVATLMIGGVGILALMLDSVQERRREIGVRLAVGGRRRDLLGQFFAETLLIGTLGGAVGLVIGTLAAAGLGSIDAPDLVPIPILRADIIVIAMVVMMFTSVASGLIADLVLATLRSLSAHKLRFALTSLGVAWGVLVLTFLSGSMDGFDRYFYAQMTKVWPKIVYVFPGAVLKQSVGNRGARSIELEREDVERMRGLDAVEYASPNAELGARVLRAGRRTKLIHTLGMSPAAAQIRSFDLAEGRFLSPADIESSERVVYLGADAAARLFGRDTGLVGKSLHIDSLRFRVIGVGQRKGDQLVNVGRRDDELAVIPISTAQRWLTNDDLVSQVVIAPRTREEAATTIGLVRGLIGMHHRFDSDEETALVFFDISEALQLIEVLGLGLRIFLVATSLVTLLVGAVGVMNIMLVVVSERRTEIGLRKAIGASRRAIFVQFLSETLAATLIAGAAGLGCGWLAIAIFGGGDGPGAIWVPTNAIFVFVTLVGVGLAAGLLPAVRASKVEPAIALRAL
jgi:putative ABC transport system permease protein